MSGVVGLVYTVHCYLWLSGRVSGSVLLPNLAGAGAIVYSLELTVCGGARFRVVWRRSIFRLGCSVVCYT